MHMDWHTQIVKPEASVQFKEASYAGINQDQDQDQTEIQTTSPEN